jgi:hypothetical protein
MLAQHRLDPTVLSQSRVVQSHLVSEKQKSPGGAGGAWLSPTGAWQVPGGCLVDGWPGMTSPGQSHLD